MYLSIYFIYIFYLFCLFFYFLYISTLPRWVLLIVYMRRSGWWVRLHGCQYVIIILSQYNQVKLIEISVGYLVTCPKLIHHLLLVFLTVQWYVYPTELCHGGKPQLNSSVGSTSTEQFSGLFSLPNWTVQWYIYPTEQFRGNFYPTEQNIP